MRRIILSMMVSIDGLIATNDPEEYWHNFDDEIAAYILDLIHEVDLFIYGRKAYEEMIEYWPNDKGEFGRIMNETKKLVVSRSLEKAVWNASVVSEVNPEKIRELKNRPGKNIALFAGAEIATEFMKLDLIDEYRLMINPVWLGSGKPLFTIINKHINFNLTGTRVFNNGNIILIKKKKRLTNGW